MTDGSYPAAWPIRLILALFCIVTAAAQQWTPASQTAALVHAAATDGWSPKPTAAVSWPEILRRQEQGPTSVCGYVGLNASEPVTCENAYCGYNTLGGTSVAGCCTATAATGGLLGCLFATTCYDFNACGASCSSANRLNDYYTCYSSIDPYCGVLQYTDGAVSFFCTNAPSMSFLAAHTFAPESSSSQQQSSSTPQFSSSKLTSPHISNVGGGGGSGGSGSGGGSSSTTPAPVPFTQSQMTGSGTSQTSAVSTTVLNGQCRLQPSLLAVGLALLGTLYIRASMP